MSEYKYISLNHAARFSEKRIKLESLTLDTYVSTENMISDRGGITTANSLPKSKTVPKFKKNNILLSNIRPYFKKIYLAKDRGGCSNDVLVLEINEKFIEKFIYYVLSDNNFFNYATVTSKGTKMPRGSKTAIMKYLVPDISIEKQNEIVNILSTYDNLIENNNHRIDLLDQMAQELYKEWFVRMRFPGYETTKFVNGIPDGWELIRIEDAYEVMGGATPSTKNQENWDGDIPWITPNDMSKHTDSFIYKGERSITKLGFSSCSTVMLPKYSILFTSRAPVGYIAIAGTDVCTNQGFKSIKNSSGELDSYLFLMMKYNVPNFKMYANGATFVELSSKDMKRFKLLMPEKKLINNFNIIANPILERIDKLAKQKQNLINQRDLLLPRLLSGKLKV